MRTLLLALPLLLAGPALALDGVVHVRGEVVTLDSGRGSVRLVPDTAEQRRLIAEFGALEGLQAVVEGRLRESAPDFVVREVVQPRAGELEGLVVERGGALSLVWGENRVALVGPRVELLRSLVNREVQLRAFVFLRDGRTEVAPVAVRALEGGRSGVAATVTGRLEWKDAPTVTDASGRTVTLVGFGSRDVPRGVGLFQGREVAVAGTLFGDALVLDRFVSPAPARLTGRVEGEALVAQDGRRLALLSDSSRNLLALLAKHEGQEVTVKGLASRDAFLVDGVAARAEGQVEASGDFQLPDDGQVWIAQYSAEGGQIVVADGVRGHALAPGYRLSRPTQGIAGALGR
jgi:hypothetical protein